VARKDAQSALAVSTCSWPWAVPVTARAQLSALHDAARVVPRRERVRGMRNCMVIRRSGYELHAMIN
jgi:hypothetical protein